MRKPGYAGIPAALSLATPKQRRKKKKSARRPAAAASFPVFYDKSGKRLRRLVMVGSVLLLAFGAVAANMIPAMLAPTLTADSDDRFARQYLADGDPTDVPSIGTGGVLTRMVTVVRENTRHRSAVRPRSRPAGANTTARR